MPDETLGEKVRAAMSSGRLPSSRPSRMFNGPGAGARCAACGDPVPRSEMEFELEFQRVPVSKGKSPIAMLKRFNAKPEIRRYHLHQRCFTAWEFERIQAGQPERRPST
jgi:hypothetical protein